MPTNRQPLTDRQRQVLDLITTSIASRGFPPTLREIGDSMGIRSTNGVSDHLRALEKKGWITRSEMKSRATRVIGNEDASADPGAGGHDCVASSVAEVRPGDRVFVRGGKPVAGGVPVLVVTDDGLACVPNRPDIQGRVLGQVVGFYRRLTP